MGKYTGICSECAVPMDRRDSIPLAKRAPIMAQVVIGTPGTIKNLITYKKLGVTKLKILVFDEADQMLAEVIFFMLIRCCLTRLTYKYNHSIFH